MQTFLPDPLFRNCASVLDNKRLGKQRVECKQIINSLYSGTGWYNHPATQMWTSNVPLLAAYGFIMCEEWLNRGFDDSMLAFFMGVLANEPDTGVDPWWLGHEDFHRSHRSNLLRKNPEHYRQYWPDEPDDLPYLWPLEDMTFKVIQ